MREFGTLSGDAHLAMKECGNAGPTVNVKDKTVKGHAYDDDGSSFKTYYTSDHLRMLARGMIEVADWLDERAA